MKRKGKDSLAYIMGLGFIDFEFDLISQYINHMETHFETELKIVEKDYTNFNKKLEKDTSDYSDKHIGYIEDSFIDNFFMLKDVYLKNYRNAQIIQLYSYLEDILKKGCDRYASYKQTDYKVDDLRGSNDIDKIKKYLRQSIKIDFSQLNPEWQFLDNLRQIRNLVVHHKGKIKNNDPNNNSDKKFKTIANFSKDRFKLKPIGSSENHFELVFDKSEFFKEIIRNIENLVHKIGINEVD